MSTKCEKKTSVFGYLKNPSVGPSVGLSVRPSVRHTLLFWGFRGLWPHCPCQNDQVSSNTAPAHPHATGVAVYPALLYLSVWPSVCLFVCVYATMLEEIWRHL